MVTLLPGFADPVHDAQRAFRALLDAMAQPGRLYHLPSLPPLPHLTAASAAACLTLLDNEVTLWLGEGLSPSRQWLQFHTGCRFAPSPEAADFALVAAAQTLPAFNPGCAEFPEASTTVLLQVPSLTAGQPVELRGPGIPDERAIAPQVPPGFWELWQRNQRRYPLGIDAFLLGKSQVMGLPRTSQVILSP